MENKIGNKIKKVREEKNISQYELAKKIKYLNQSQICKIENGKRFVRANELKQIADVLSVPMLQLIS